MTDLERKLRELVEKYQLRRAGWTMDVLTAAANLGAEAMRERAAKEAEGSMEGDSVAIDIRALPLPSGDET
jgi:hypothetical protein